MNRMPQSKWRMRANRGSEEQTKCKWDDWEQIGVLSQYASCVYMGQETEVYSEVGARSVQPAICDL